MTDLRRDAPNVLETTRVRGGASARLVAVAVAGVLGLVVWIGISGRPAPVVPASLGPDLAQVSSPSPSTTAAAVATPVAVTTPAPVISPTPRPAVTPRPGAAFVATDHYSVVATIGNRQFITMLEQTEEGRLSGILSVPIPPPATNGTLELAQVWSTVSHDAFLTLAKWDLRLESLSAASGREYLVLDRSVPARRTLRNVPAPVTSGYTITVRAQSGIYRGLLSVDIRVGPNRQLVGDDGIFGSSVVAQLPMPTPEGPRVTNGCHWHGRPPPSRRPPWPTYDETSCG